MQALNWDDLRYFLALARAHTVSGAGRNLGVKHTTVARRISALETQLGSQVFDQSSEGYFLNALGENLYDYAQEMEERALAVGREVNGMAKGLSGPLKLIGLCELLNTVVMPKMKRFSEQHPGVSLELNARCGLTDDSARQADIIVAMVEKPPNFLVGRKVADIHYGVYATHHYLSALRTCHSAVLLNSEHRMPDWLKRNFPGADIALRTSDAPTMLSAVKAHMGLARLPCFVADKEQCLVRVDVPLSQSNCGIWVLNHIEQIATERARVCKDFLYKNLNDQRFLIEGECSRFAS